MSDIELGNEKHGGKDQPETGRGVGLRSVFPSHSALKWNYRRWAFFSNKERLTKEMGRYVEGRCQTELGGEGW